MSSHYPTQPPTLLQYTNHSSTHARELHYDPLMHTCSSRRVNIYSLPVELLTRVFVLGAGYDYPYHETPFLLKPDQDYYAIPSSTFQANVSQVCHHWRQIALRTPSLWNILHFRELGHIARAREYISRCLHSPHLFDILVDTVASSEHIDGVTLCREEIQQIFSIICPHVKRWRAFHLKVRDHECKAAARQHLSSCGPAPNLETLQLYHFEDYLTSRNLYLATYRPPVVVFSNELPRLRNVSLIGVNLPWEQSPYLAHLHTLELALHPENIRPPYEYWESMLRNSPDLQTLSLHYSGPRVANGDTKLIWSTDKERITIQSLESLSLTDLDPDYLVQLMGRVVLPGLKRLSLDLPEQDFTPFVDFITNTKRHTTTPGSPICLPQLPFPSLSTLESLVLTALESSADSLRNLLRGLKGLRSLEVHFASVSDVFVHVMMEEMDIEVKEDADVVLLRATPLKAGAQKGCPPSCPSRAQATSISSRVERVPVLPLLETLKMSGLPGTKIRELIQFRHSRCRKMRSHGAREDVSRVSRWIVKWSERWKGSDQVIDELVERGWLAEDGTRVYLETYNGEDDVDVEGDDEDIEDDGNDGGDDGNEDGDIGGNAVEVESGDDEGDDEDDDLEV